MPRADTHTGVRCRLALTSANDIFLAGTVHNSLQAALDEYPLRGGKIDYELVTGVRKAPGTKKKK